MNGENFPLTNHQVIKLSGAYQFEKTEKPKYREFIKIKYYRASPLFDLYDAHISFLVQYTLSYTHGCDILLTSNIFLKIYWKESL